MRTWKKRCPHANWRALLLPRAFSACAIYSSLLCEICVTDCLTCVAPNLFRLWDCRHDSCELRYMILAPSFFIELVFFAPVTFLKCANDHSCAVFPTQLSLFFFCVCLLFWFLILIDAFFQHTKWTSHWCDHARIIVYVVVPYSVWSRFVSCSMLITTFQEKWTYVCNMIEREVEKITEISNYFPTRARCCVPCLDRVIEISFFFSLVYIEPPERESVRMCKCDGRLHVCMCVKKTRRRSDEL